MKYINKQTGEIVEVVWHGAGYWAIWDKDNFCWGVFFNEPFKEQFGQAMICPREDCPVYCVCTKAEPHICDEACGTMNCPACIPYVEKSDDKK